MTHATVQRDASSAAAERFTPGSRGAGDERPAAPYLDISYRKYDEASWRQTRRPFCLNSPTRWLGGQEVQDVRCRRQNCFACSGPHLLQIMDAIDVAQPRMMLTLTGLSTDLVEAQAAIAKYCVFLREHRVEYMAVLERHESGGLHAHLFTHGTRLGVRVLHVAGVARGIPNVQTRPFRVGHFHAKRYLFKDVTTAVGLQRHLADNHGHFIFRHSAGFWRNVATGESYGGLTTAKDAARRRYVAAHSWGTTTGTFRDAGSHDGVRPRTKNTTLSTAKATGVQRDGLDKVDASPLKQGGADLFSGSTGRPLYEFFVNCGCRHPVCLHGSSRGHCRATACRCNGPTSDETYWRPALNR